MINKLVIEYVKSYIRESSGEDEITLLSLPEVIENLQPELRANIGHIYKIGKKMFDVGFKHYDVRDNVWVKAQSDYTLSFKEICVLVEDWKTFNRIDYRGNYANTSNI